MHDGQMDVTSCMCMCVCVSFLQITSEYVVDDMHFFISSLAKFSKLMTGFLIKCYAIAIVRVIGPSLILSPTSLIHEIGLLNCWVVRSTLVFAL